MDDGQHWVSNAVDVAFLGGLVYDNQALLPLLELHLTENEGEFLPHLLISDIGRWLETRVAEVGADGPVVAILDRLELGMAAADASLDELISASFLEMLLPDGESSTQLLEHIGPKLRARLSGMEMGL